jgi:hypothetical protein
MKVGDPMSESQESSSKTVFQSVYEANRRLVRRKTKQSPWVVWGLRFLYVNVGFWIPIMGFCLWAILRFDKKKDAIYALLPAIISGAISLFLRFYPIIVQLINELRMYPQG